MHKTKVVLPQSHVQASCGAWRGREAADPVDYKHPYLSMAQYAELLALPTLFGLIGGVKTMGLVGLFVGPVLMALLMAIWREWLLTTESVTTPEVELESAVAFDHPAPAEGVVATAVIAPQKTTAWSPSTAQNVPGP
jgi:hypothetical protein